MLHKMICLVDNKIPNKMIYSIGDGILSKMRYSVKWDAWWDEILSDMRCPIGWHTK